MFSNIFQSTVRTSCQISMQNWEVWILSNGQIGIRVDIRIVMIMVLE
jgi:hypothetical protein